MKVRDSGMPDEEMWNSFFSPAKILALLGLDADTRGVAKFGCGYGTFSLAAARLTQGMVHAFDIEPAMVAVQAVPHRKDGGVVGIGLIRHLRVVNAVHPGGDDSLPPWPVSSGRYEAALWRQISRRSSSSGKRRCSRREKTRSLSRNTANSLFCSPATVSISTSCTFCFNSAARLVARG
ncbi:hypothetical protein SAMN05660860_00723 [Geoalkalibacter ferrihydriticus]|uniref:Methyltransferase domain-containing protein n=1 Tax=Geoalkalibacter ferrihydriticus TaxID=392333 RepID=A0A1G9KCP4_9BACT|nr:hypothetical protein SAMN05660860_00723 [Geoalkalibacter ferrihydriticus]